MRAVIVPNYISDAITEKVDKALEMAPEFKEFRQEIFDHMLDHFDQTGTVADFTLKPRTQE